MSRRTKPKIIDLFAGVGGFSLGAVRAGFELAAAVDLDRHAVDAHTKNFPHATHARRNILNLSGDGIRLVRSRAKEWNINPDRIGVMGFSAGGELAALAAMRFDQPVTNVVDSVDGVSALPAFQALIYPGQSQRIEPTTNSPPAFLACGYQDRKDIAEGLAGVYLGTHVRNEEWLRWLLVGGWQDATKEHSQRRSVTEEQRRQQPTSSQPEGLPIFGAVAGIVEFRSPDTAKLPITTTKRGVDTGKDVYTLVRQRMQEGLKCFTRNTNRWKGFEPEIKSRFDHINFLDLKDLKRVARKLPAASLGGEGEQKQYKPDLPPLATAQGRRAGRRISILSEEQVDSTRCSGACIIRLPPFACQKVIVTGWKTNFGKRMGAN